MKVFILTDCQYKIFCTQRKNEVWISRIRTLASGSKVRHSTNWANFRQVLKRKKLGYLNEIGQKLEKSPFDSIVYRVHRWNISKIAQMVLAWLKVMPESQILRAHFSLSYHSTVRATVLTNFNALHWQKLLSKMIQNLAHIHLT